MQIRRSNYAHNFLNAIDTDHMAAWDMFVNEINELLINDKQSVIQAIRAAEVRVHDKDSLKVISDLIHDKIYAMPILRKNLNKLILSRHKNQNVSAEAGTHDKLYSNANGNVSSTNVEDNDQVSAINQATNKLVLPNENVNSLSVSKETVKSLAAENLKNKIEYAGINEGKVFSRQNIKIGLIVLSAAVLIYAAYKISKK
jgi:hypothetical protein